MNIRPLVLATAIVAVFAASPSLAESVTVEYQDLDLSRDQDRATLERRLDAAARKVCGIDETKTGTRMRSTAASSCYKSARKNVGEQFAAMLQSGKSG